MVRIVEVGDVTYSDFNWRLTKTEIEREVEKNKADKYEPRKILIVYRDKKGRTLIIWERVKKK